MNRLSRLARSARSTYVARTLLFAFIAPSLSLAASDDALLSSFNRAKNVARMNCGAQIECILPNGRVIHVAPDATADTSEAAALIMEDDTVSCALPEGETNFIVKLPNTNLIDRLTFLNENAAAQGELSVAVSNYRLPLDSPKWKEVEGKTKFSHKRMFDLSLLGIEAKFVKLRFRVAKGGRIAGFGLYGEQSLEAFAKRELHIARINYDLSSPTIRDRVNFNFANLYARAHIVHVSSGSVVAARRMIDDDPITSFQFSPNDRQPTVIIELSETQRLHRVSAIYDMQPGRVDVYTLNSLRADLSDLRDLTPIASATDSNGDGKAAVNFDPHGARYVALRWTPARETPTAFHVAEIDAFGTVPFALLDGGPAPDLLASDNFAAKPTDSSPDFSNTLGTLADPPVVSPLSP